MSFDSNVIHQAQELLEQRRLSRVREQERRRQEIIQKLPRLSEIDREIRLSMVEVARASFGGGTDPAGQVFRLKRKVQNLQRERQDLLVANGYSPTALEETPNCPHCNDTGWVGVKMCACLEELCQKVQIQTLSSMLDLGGQSFETFRLDYYPDKVEEGWFISPRDAMAGVYQSCLSYANDFPNHPFKNLYLNGAPGLGKTFLSAAIARVVAAKGYSVVYDSAVNIFSQFEARKFEKDPEAQTSTQRYLNCDLLILDDLGSEMTTVFTQSVLYEIVNTRLISGAHTIISSNLSVPDLSLRYQPQIYSRIAGVYAPLTFLGEDIRLKQMK